ncbi:MAG: HlyD family efflux transporter periplasmic adaptor subunit [Thiobacillus sp.]|nr:HlyD family efflux transporter periplasmic adaptor subunit [Thiobacillus sp.]
MTRKSLFRREALQTHRPRWMGEVVLIQPTNYRVLSFLAFLIGLAVVLVLTLGTYTRRSTVAGLMMPDMGLIRITAPQAGRIAERRVDEGQTIRAGEILYVLSGERQTSNGGEIEARIGEQVRTQGALLSEEARQIRQLQAEESVGLHRQIAGLDSEEEKLAKAIALQQQRTSLSIEVERRYSELLEKKYVSREQYEQKKSDALDQAAQLRGLERDQVRIRREMADRQRELVASRIRYEAQLSQLAREIAGNQQELTLSEGRRGVSVPSPSPGVATAPLVEPGQAVEAGQTLVSVVPQGSRLIAHLYAPSRSAGFVRAGTRVRLRLHAFPYQKFGQPEGRVLSVSRAPMLPAELGAAKGEQGGEPMYLVKVALQDQSIMAYGKPVALQTGMLLEADLMSESRRLYEWALEPLLSLSGKL